MSDESVEDKLTEAPLRAADRAAPEIIATLRETALAMIAEELETRRGEFASEYGWAFSAVRKLDSSFGGNRVTFDAIQRCAGIGHLRPYYKRASNQVHAGPRGAAFTLGSIERRRINPVGASNAGLADAGQGTLLSLVQVMSTLSAHKPQLERLLTAKVQGLVGLPAVSSL